MPTWIALFRGINVGGSNRVTMKALCGALDSQIFRNVRSYIQSGNLVFESSHRSAPALVRDIGKRLANRLSFRPKIVVFSRADWASAIENNPFPHAVSSPDKLHFFFLEETVAKLNWELLERAQAANEETSLKGRVFYLFAPDGIGRSKLATQVEKHLGVAATARNYRTVVKLAEMAGENGE